jgi:hypothetical protein
LYFLQSVLGRDRVVVEATKVVDGYAQCILLFDYSLFDQARIIGIVLVGGDEIGE